MPTGRRKTGRAPNFPGASSGLEWHRYRDGEYGTVNGDKYFLLDPSADGDWVLWLVNPRTGVQIKRINRFVTSADAKDEARRLVSNRLEDSSTMADKLIAAGARAHAMFPSAIDSIRGANPAQFWFFAMSSRRDDARVVEAAIGKDAMQRAARRLGSIVRGGYIVDGTAYVMPTR
jgi:hypothetical protein